MIVIFGGVVGKPPNKHPCQVGEPRIGNDVFKPPLPVGKESGETAHVERWNNTFRQRRARFVRKSLSFSKSDVYHEIALKLFLYEHNLRVIS